MLGARDDGTFHLVEIDSVSHALSVISFEHHEIHEGHSFERHIDSANAAVAGLNVAFKTAPGTKLVHMLLGWSSNDEVLVEGLEGATWTQGTGTATTFYNHNRETINTSTAILEDKNQATFTANHQIIKDVTGIAGGEVFEKQYTYNAGLGAATTVESREAGHEWVLKPDTTYVIRLTQTDGNCKMSIDLHWYEHKSRDSG